MTRFAFHRPRTLDQALSLKAAEHGSRYVAGGTDVMVQVRQGQAPPALVSLGRIEELRGIRLDEGARIGGLTTFAEILEHEALCARYPVLAQAAAAVGSVQIRNRATIGGNLANASPCADSAPALLVLDARLGLVGPDGRREVPVADFFVGPGKTCLGADELVAEVVLDAPVGRGRFWKKGRVRMDLAVASVALQLEAAGGRITHARVAAGSVAPVPLRLREVERLLVSGEGPAAAGRAAAAGVAPITDVRASADWRRQLVGVYVRRVAEELLS